MSSNLRPKTVIAVDPDIDVNDSNLVEWATAFRTQPTRDMIIMDGLLAGPLDRASTSPSPTTSSWAPRWASMPPTRTAPS